MWLTVDVAINELNWYVVMLTFMMILIWDDVVNDDHVNMNWCYYWYEMMWLLLIMSLRWEDVDVESDIEMRCWWCWKCVEMMHVMYVREGVHWPCRMSLVGENKVVKEFKHLWGDDLGSLIHSWSVYLMVPTFYTLYVVYVHGGALTLSDVLGGGK